VAQQHHGAGLRLADERDDVDDHRESRHPRRYLANSSIRLLESLAAGKSRS